MTTRPHRRSFWQFSTSAGSFALACSTIALAALVASVSAQSGQHPPLNGHRVPPSMMEDPGGALVEPQSHGLTRATIVVLDIDHSVAENVTSIKLDCPILSDLPSTSATMTL